MEIVKKLDLNKNYQNVDNGSLVFAKNIRVSDDYSYITNDYGFIEAIEVEEGQDSPLTNKTIVGVIPCDKEIVLFCTDDNNISYIIRLEEFDKVLDDGAKETRLRLHGNVFGATDSSKGWHYHGGKITGTYTYNVEKQLVIAVSEYDCDEDVPLKVINLDTLDGNYSEDKLSAAPDVPVANLVLTDYLNGVSIPNGVYYFFVRFEISKNNYTDWFPVGGVYYALRAEKTAIIAHQYNTLEKEDAHGHGGWNTSTTAVARHVNNTNKDSNISFQFELNLFNTRDADYNRLQIGYILQKENASFGRIWKTFPITSNTIKFNFDAKFKQEIGVDNLLANAFNLYNVKHLSSYEGRLYIANYKETDYNVSGLNADKVHLSLFNGNAEVKSSVDITGTTVDEQGNATTGNFNGRRVRQQETANISIFSLEFTKEWCEKVNVNPGTIEFEVPLGQTSIRLGDYPSITNFIAKGTAWLINTIPNWEARNAQFSEVNGTKYVITPLGSLYLRLHGFNLEMSTDNPISSFYLDKECTKPASSGQTYLCCNATTLYYGDTIPDETVGYIPRTSLILRKWSDNTNVDPQNDNLDNVGGENQTSNGNNLELSYRYPETIAIGTLMPGNAYKFFVHYVKKDGTYTNGIEIPIGNIVSEGVFVRKSYNKNILFVNYIKEPVPINIKTHCSELPDGYVGYFISYAKPEITTPYQAYCLGSINIGSTNLTMNGITADSVHIRGFKSSEVEVGLVNYHAKRIKHCGYDSIKTVPIIDITSIISGGSGVVKDINIDLTDNDGKIITYTGNSGKDINNIKLEPGLCYFTHDDINDASHIFNEDYIYSDDNKELIRLCDTITNTEEKTLYPKDCNYPAYVVVDECVRLYGYRITDDGRVYTTSNLSGDISFNEKYYLPYGTEYASLLKYTKYSHYNIYAMSFKKEPERAVTILKTHSPTDGDKDIPINSIIVKAINLSDLLHFESAFTPSNLKAYTNYSEYNTYSNHKTNVIRRSDIISDESLEDSWRNFRANSYKVIPSNKGIITNILGIGNFFLIHCEHTLLSIDRSQLLKTNEKVVQTEIPDTFEVEPVDVFTSQHGYGGLQLIDGWCVNQYGYFFIDSDSRRIFNYDNNQLNDLTSPIIKWFRDKKIKKCVFLNDPKYNRVFIKLTYEPVGNGYDTLVLSYYPELKSFISIHDFDFDVNCSTKDNAYFIINNTTEPDINKLSHKYSKNNNVNIMTDVVTRGLYNDYCKSNNEFYAKAIYRRGYGIPRTVGYASVVDIIFNMSYEVVKSLEWISYLLSDEKTHKPEDDVDYNWFGEVVIDEITRKLFDEDKYSGDELRIYTDSCDSGILNIDINYLNKANEEENLNKDYEKADGNLSDAYKYPYYYKGVWNLNYFRNLINNYDRTPELIEKAKEIILRGYGKTKDSLTEDEKAKLNELAKNYVYSDQLSLIYGKYIILRFTFLNNVPIRFENVGIKLNRY